MSSRILATSAQPAQAQATRRTFSDTDFPPRRHDCNGLLDVLLTDDQTRSIENTSVDCGLSTESAQAIAIRLDLVAVNRAIHDCHVDAHLSAAQAELLDKCNIGFVAVSMAKTLQELFPNLAIAKERCSGGRDVGAHLATPGKPTIGSMAWLTMPPIVHAPTR